MSRWMAIWIIDEGRPPITASEQQIKDGKLCTQNFTPYWKRSGLTGYRINFKL